MLDNTYEWCRHLCLNNSLFPAHQSLTKYFRKTFRQMYLWPHQLQKTNDKKSNLCCMKNFVWDWWAGNKELLWKPSQDRLKVICVLFQVQCCQPWPCSVGCCGSHKEPQRHGRCCFFTCFELQANGAVPRPAVLLLPAGEELPLKTLVRERSDNSVVFFFFKCEVCAFIHCELLSHCSLLNNVCMHVHVCVCVCVCVCHSLCLYLFLLINLSRSSPQVLGGGKVRHGCDCNLCTLVRLRWWSR